MSTERELQDAIETSIREKRIVRMERTVEREAVLSAWSDGGSRCGEGDWTISDYHGGHARTYVDPPGIEETFWRIWLVPRNLLLAWGDE